MINKSIKVKFILFFTAIIFLIGGAYCAVRLFFPSTIVIRSGESSTLSFNLPLKGELLCDNLAVSAVNDKPVTENINVSLSKPFTLKAESSGMAQLRLSFCGIPIKSSTITVLPDTEMIPGGQAVGLELNTDGILVLGTGEVRTQSGKYVSPCGSSLKSGDLIKKADKTVLTDKESLISYVEGCIAQTVTLTVDRNGEKLSVRVTPVVSSESGKKKLGIWVRDSTQGIGTITCYDKKGNFYALGHPVTDVDTGEIMKIRDGKIMPTKISSVNPGEKGNPGELLGNTDKNNTIGSVTANTECGIYGRLSSLPNKSTEARKIALKNEVKEGPATILVTTHDNRVNEYDIEIENSNTFSLDASKAMVIRITDKELIKQTGGIVQGMSGAPVLQNGRLVGAVTHVFIQDPSKGYGIYIEDMIEGR